MIFNFSYRDRELIRKINEMVGKPFGFWERIKMKGIGSPIFTLSHASEGINTRLPKDLSMVKVSFELRPNGVIVHFKKYTEHYTWVIPYYRLSVYQSRDLSIHAEGEYMKLSTLKLRKSHHTFIQRLISLKALFSADFIEN